MIRPSADEGETTPTDIIYSPSDVPVDYNEACRMRRSHSFSQPRRQNQSFDSLESGAVYGCSTLGRRGSSRRDEGQGRLKEHRQRARRAVTLHNLDTQQLMLILSLQMRYLQENSSQCQAQMNTKKLEMQNRRSLTPEPQSIKQKNALLDKDLNSAKIIRSHTPQPYQVRKAPTPKPAEQNNFYENAHGLGSPLDYENVDSCVSAAQMTGLLRSAAVGGALGNQRGLVTLAQDGPSAQGKPNSRLHTGEVVCGTGVNGTLSDGSKSLGSAKASTRANSYEDIDNVSARGINLPSTALRHPIYENQHETKVTSASGVKPHVTGSHRKRWPKPNPSNTTSSSECSDQEHPTRPKSYISAVEGTKPAYCHDECQSAIGRPGRDLQHAPYSTAQAVGMILPRSLPSPSVSTVSSSPAFGSGKNLHNGSHVGVDDLQLDIYARPNKKGKGMMPRRGLTPQLTSSGYTCSADDSSRKSAFHKVSRVSSLPSSDAACDTDLDDLETAVVQRPKRVSSKPLPPYSPPPSYECLAHSRNSSLHSIASSSSHTTDEGDFYRQITKTKGPARNALTPSHGGSSHGLEPGNSRRHLNRHGNTQSATQSGSPSYLRSQNGYACHQFQDFQFNHQGDQVEIHSFPFRKNHHQQTSYDYCQGQVPVVKGPPSLQSYENLDDVFEDPNVEQQVLLSDRSNGSRGLSECQMTSGSQRMDVMHGKRNCHKAQYEGIMHLSSNDDSDSEVMETVI